MHKSKLAGARDFQRLAGEQHDCSSIVCVPLPCHSRLVPSGAQATVQANGALFCAHCHRRLEAAARPLGCITLGVRRRANFSIREYLSKSLVLAGFLGPRLLRAAPALQQLPQQQASRQQAPPPQQQQPQQQRDDSVEKALQSSWYAGPPRQGSPQSQPSPQQQAQNAAQQNSLAALGDSMRRLSVDADMALATRAAGRMSMDSRLDGGLHRTSLDSRVDGGLHRMSMDSRVGGGGLHSASLDSQADNGLHRMSMDSRVGSSSLHRLSMDAFTYASLPPATHALLVAASQQQQKQQLDLGYAGDDGRLSLDSQASTMSSAVFGGDYLYGGGQSRGASCDLPPFYPQQQQQATYLQHQHAHYQQLPPVSEGLPAPFPGMPHDGYNPFLSASSGLGAPPSSSPWPSSEADKAALVQLVQQQPDSMQLMMALYGAGQSSQQQTGQ